MTALCGPVIVPAWSSDKVKSDGKKKKGEGI